MQKDLNCYSAWGGVGGSVNHTFESSVLWVSVSFIIIWLVLVVDITRALIG